MSYINGFNLKYRTYDQLLADVLVDFRNYSMESLIDPQDLIKIARKLNREIGLKIYLNKERVIEIEHGKAKLPDDFYVANFALLCGEFTVESPVIQGTQVEEINCSSNTTCSCSKPCNCSIVPNYICAPPPVDTSNTCPTDPDPCDPPVTCSPCQLNKCGGEFKLVQIVKTETRTYKHLFPVKLRKSVFVDCDCPNVNWTCANEAWIQDGFIYSNFTCGKIYINYQAMLEDEEGNLLVPDHELINEYYEYALKERVMENLYFNGEDVERKLGYIQQKLRLSRIQALSLVNMPDYSEMKKMWEVNRKAMYNKYYSLFASYGPYTCR
jgi:hypothetical protein